MILDKILHNLADLLEYSVCAFAILKYFDKKVIESSFENFNKIINFLTSKDISCYTQSWLNVLNESLTLTIKTSIYEPMDLNTESLDEIIANKKITLTKPQDLFKF